MTKRFDFRTVSALQELKFSLKDNPDSPIVLNVRQLGFRILQFLSFLKRKHGEARLYFRDYPASGTISQVCVPKNVGAKKLEEMVFGANSPKFSAKEVDLTLILHIAEKLSWTCTLKLIGENGNDDNAYLFFNKGNLTTPTSQQKTMFDAGDASATSWWRVSSWDKIPEKVKECLYKPGSATSNEINDEPKQNESDSTPPASKEISPASKTIQEILGNAKKATTKQRREADGRSSSVEKILAGDSPAQPQPLGKAAELTGEFQSAWENIMRKKKSVENDSKTKPPPTPTRKETVEKEKHPDAPKKSKTDNSFDSIMDDALDAIIMKKWDQAYDLLLKAKKINPDSPKLKINLKRLEEMGYGSSKEVSK
jgi:hypothetical protein